MDKSCLNSKTIIFTSINLRQRQWFKLTDKETMRIRLILPPLGNSFGELIPFPIYRHTTLLKLPAMRHSKHRLKVILTLAKSIGQPFNVSLDIKNGAARYEGLDVDIHPGKCFGWYQIYRPDMKDLEVNINNTSSSGIRKGFPEILK